MKAWVAKCACAFIGACSASPQARAPADGTHKYILHYPSPFALLANGTGKGRQPVCWAFAQLQFSEQCAPVFAAGSYVFDAKAAWRWDKSDYVKQRPPFPLSLPPGDSASGNLLVRCSDHVLGIKCGLL